MILIVVCDDAPCAIERLDKLRESEYPVAICPLATKVTGEPLRPAALAVAVLLFVPVPAPMRHCTKASP